MRFILFLALFFVLFSLVPAQSSTNAVNATTVAPATKQRCQEVNPTCDGQGVCQNDGTCRCYYSYFGRWNGQTGGNGTSCPWNVANQAVALVPTIRAYRIYLGVLFGLVLLLSLYRLLLEIGFGFDSFHKTSSRTLTLYVLILLVSNCLWLFLQALDYWGNYLILPIKFYYFVFFAPQVTFVLLFAAIFLHWVELYQRATKSLQKEAMLRKIKPDYEANVSIEDLLLKISFLRKFRFFYLGFAVIALGIFVAVMIVQLHGKELSGWHAMNLVNQSFYLALWILFTIGFIVYGLRLMRIMPSSMARKVKIMTYLLCTFSISAMCNSIIKLANGRYQSAHALYAIFAFAFLDWVCCFAALNIYMPIWQWNQWFNKSVIASLLSNGTGSGSSKGRESKNDGTSGSIELSGSASVIEPSATADV